MSLTYGERWKRMQIARATIQQLALFDSPDKVAEWLRLEGIRGRRHQPCQCPVALLLRQETGAGTVKVDHGVAQVYRWESPIRLPQVVQDFVNLFDEGRYPRLVKR
jgi:hypothetical protein